MTPSDPFDTGNLRELTLRTWRDNPARFREDANTEEDYARGYYRDRLVIELAQNAADAAADTGGHVLFALRQDGSAPSGWALIIANTGVPLTKEGAASLSSLRTSAKRELGAEANSEDLHSRSRPIGHFGVGFSAVRAVSDEVIVQSQTGGLRFSLGSVQDALQNLDAIADPDLGTQDTEPGTDAALRAEIARRGTELPILRLPWPAAALDDSQWATVITVRLRDAAAVAQTRALLADVDDPLLIGLPRLTSITVEIDGEETRTVEDIDHRWFITRHTGEIPADLVGSLPVEERERAGWSITWATPRGSEPGSSPFEETSLLGLIAEHAGEQALKRTLLAPTPTDEPVTVPGILIVTLPLDPTRRRIRPGPVTDWMINQVGVVAVDHARQLSDPLAFVPVGLPGGEIDAALHRAIRDHLASAALLHTLTGEPIAPRDATAIVLATGANNSLIGSTPVVDLTALEELASGLENIVDVPRHRLSPAAALGVTPRDVADVVTEIPTGRTPQRWRETYAALEGLSREVGGLAALGSLPVPLADGRVVAGARGAFLLNDDLPESCVQRLTHWGLRIIDPGANHPLLESLGAASVGAADLIDEPEVRATVRQLRDNIADLEDFPDAEDDIGAVLDLVERAITLLPADFRVDGPIRPWLTDLPLRDAAEEYCGAGGLVLPGSAAERLFDMAEVAALAGDLAAAFDAETWRAVGVRDRIVVVAGEIILDAWDLDHSIDQVIENINLGMLDQIDDYLYDLADYWLEGRESEPGETLTFELRTLADLDIVTADAWPQVAADARAWADEHGADIPVPGRDESFPHYLRWWLTQTAGSGQES